MKRSKFIVLFSVSAILISCSKENLKFLRGHYSSTYYYQAYIMPSPVISAGAVILKLESGNTFDRGGFTDRRPAGGSGDFKILKNNTLSLQTKTCGLLNSIGI